MADTKLPVWKLRVPSQAEVLRASAQPALGLIEQPDFQHLIDDMVATMYQAEGIGLAAPQIGKSIRLAVIAGEVDDRTEPLVLINPVIESPSLKQASMEEGCLSIPKVYGMVNRSASLELSAFDRRGKAFRLRAHGLLARVIQHEFDHLNGKLIVDRAEPITQGKELL